MLSGYFRLDQRRVSVRLWRSAIMAMGVITSELFSTCFTRRCFPSCQPLGEDSSNGLHPGREQKTYIVLDRICAESSIGHLQNGENTYCPAMVIPCEQSARTRRGKIHGPCYFQRGCSCFVMTNAKYSKVPGASFKRSTATSHNSSRNN